jgi:hypothetical protein
MGLKSAEFRLLFLTAHAPNDQTEKHNKTFFEELMTPPVLKILLSIQG